ncbi:unnamed protein product [Amoebophrya sp. A25]|nr:unnamed protein product [Amoebophrya sp. A25]|eukprot:GSA25T00022480001.1
MSCTTGTKNSSRNIKVSTTSSPVVKKLENLQQSSTTSSKHHLESRRRNHVLLVVLLALLVPVLVPLLVVKSNVVNCLWHINCSNETWQRMWGLHEEYHGPGQSLVDRTNVWNAELVHLATRTDHGNSWSSSRRRAASSTHQSGEDSCCDGKTNATTKARTDKLVEKDQRTNYSYSPTSATAPSKAAASASTPGRGDDEGEGANFSAIQPASLQQVGATLRILPGGAARTGGRSQSANNADSSSSSSTPATTMLRPRKKEIDRCEEFVRYHRTAAASEARVFLYSTTSGSSSSSSTATSATGGQTIQTQSTQQAAEQSETTSGPSTASSVPTLTQERLRCLVWFRLPAAATRLQLQYQQDDALSDFSSSTSLLRRPCALACAGSWEQKPLGSRQSKDTSFGCRFSVQLGDSCLLLPADDVPLLEKIGDAVSAKTASSTGEQVTSRSGEFLQPSPSSTATTSSRGRGDNRSSSTSDLGGKKSPIAAIHVDLQLYYNTAQPNTDFYYNTDVPTTSTNSGTNYSASSQMPPPELLSPESTTTARTADITVLVHELERHNEFGRSLDNSRNAWPFYCLFWAGYVLAAICLIRLLK